MPPFAATRPVNPPGASPVLTAEQAYRGLGVKARHPEKFVPAITESRLEMDTEDKVVRYVRFNGGPEKKEEIAFFPNCIAYFEMSPDSPDSPPVRITNLLSYGPPPSNDLLLTFSFAPGPPHVGEEEAARMSPEELNDIVGKGVEKTIEVIRDMVKEGKL
ncbi:SRPBCC family protein [Rhodotorula paludigena]|uniref:SRPBCC family protein n=1 Tax=Rhodotorula paludigena TaxID=86838 RepID=UPI00316FA3C5